MPGGRPTSEPKTKLVALRLPVRLLRFVEQLAREQRVGVSEAMRRLIEERLQEREHASRDWRDLAPRAIGLRPRKRSPR
jgi:hypothetical protein